MTDINKQRFLPELGKLLTFMCEEDRQTALNMYSKLFDDAEDEQKLMDLLVSPTRQAVVIARTYNARERKEQLETQSSDNEDETPAFILAIDNLYQQVAPRHEDLPMVPAYEEEQPGQTNQFSLFPDDAHPIDDSEYVPFQIEAEAVPIEEPVEELPVEQPEEAFVPAPEEEPLPEEAPVPAEATEERTLAPEEEYVPVPEEEPLPAPVPEEVPAPLPEPEEVPVQVPEEAYDLDYIPETRRKAKVFLLILYVLLAVPLTLLGLVLLLIPTILALALAVGVIAAGSAALVVAFSGFPKLADLLLILGMSVIVLALGLLLLWLFVWFIGGAMGGLIRGAIDLGRKWCYEEVPV